MPSLSDYVEQFSSHAKYIRSTAASTSLFSEYREDGKPVPGGPFNRAVLYTPLGDLIRDIDPSELGLFTLTTHSQAAPGQGSSRVPERDAKGLPKEAVSRVEFAGATPLRKPVRRDESQKIKEPEPEVYAQAALKYLDRFQSVRPMPRARSQVVAIMDELAALRENIQTLNEVLKQSTSLGDAPSSPKSLANAEERRIHELQGRIQQLKKRKDELSKKSRPRIGRIPRPKHLPSSEKADARPPIAPSSKADPQEEMFWNTPGAHIRTLHFTDNLLMDEQVDLGDISTVSFSSPAPPRTEPLLSSRSQEDELEDNEEQGYPEEPDIPHEALDETSNKDGPEERRLDDPGDGDEQGEEGDMTIVFKKPPASVPLTPPTPAPHDQSHEEPPTPTVPKIETPLTATKKPKIKIVSDVERIVSKIWSTIGGIIMPGHPFDVKGSTASSKPPRAKETIAHLQHLSTQDPSPASPSASSSSSFSAAAPSSGHVTTQQILTAHLLLTLLWSPPNYALPLNKLKEVLAEKAGTAGQSGTRVVYTCVAKGLLKIERGRGEQLVKFDM